MATTSPAVHTGIEVHAKWSDYLKEMLHLAYDAGLGPLAEAGAKIWKWKVRLSIDGQRVADEALFAPHVVACTPGEHEFAVCFYRPGLGLLDKLLYEEKMRITVAPETVTQMLYVWGAYGHELREVGAWPWIDPETCPAISVTTQDGKAHTAKALYRASGMTMVQFQNGWRHWVDDSAIHAGASSLT